MISINATPKAMHIIFIISLVPIYFLGLEMVYICEQLLMDRY